MTTSLNFNANRFYGGLSLLALGGGVTLPFYEQKIAALKNNPYASVVQNALVSLSAMLAMMSSLTGTNASKKAKFVATVGVGVATMMPSIEKLKQFFDEQMKKNKPAV